jgi:hypothetical protein
MNPTTPRKPRPTVKHVLRLIRQAGPETKHMGRGLWWLGRWLTPAVIGARLDGSLPPGWVGGAGGLLARHTCLRRPTLRRTGARAKLRKSDRDNRRPPDRAQAASVRYGRVVSIADADLDVLLGADAAEDESDERLQEYFLETATYKEVSNRDRRLRIVVGSKGTGKSAMFRVAQLEDRAAGRLPIEVRPDDLADVAQGTLNYLQLVAAWKKGLADVIIEKSLKALGEGDEKFFGRAKRTSGRLLDVIQKSLGSEQKGFKLDPARAEAAHAFMSGQDLTIYLDDLDRGWTGKKADAQRYGAMFDAIRDLQRDNPTLRIRVGLRTDLYALIRSTDSSSDKWQSHVVHHSWSNHQTFVLLVKRVASYFGDTHDWDALLQRPQQQSAHLLNPILARQFQGKGLWHNKPMYNVIMSFARRRPRDLIVLLNLAGKRAQQVQHSVIQTDDLEYSFPRFSEGRLTDVVNEFGLEAPGLANFLLKMKPSKVERTAAQNYLLSTDAMLKRIEQALDQSRISFADGTPVTPMTMLGFLYRIDFLQARKLAASDGVDRKYFDQNRLLTPDKIDLGYDWEIHLAFRWVLQPDDVNSIFAFVPPESTD